VRTPCLRSFALAAAVVLLAGAAAWGEGVMFSKANILPLKCEESTKDYRLVGGNAPGFLYFPGERVDLTFTFKKSDARDFAIEIQGVHTRKPNKTKQYVDPFGFPDVLNLDGDPIHYPLTVAFDDKPEKTFTVEGLPVPERFGTYCLILISGERRILLGSVARVMKSRDDATVDNTPIFGEGQIFGGFRNKADAARAYGRMGVKGVRCEISWRGNRPDGTYDWSSYDRLTSDLKAGGLQAMFTLGGVGSQMYGIPTNNQPIPAAVPPNWDGNPYWGNADWGCGVQNFGKYAEWVRAFSERYWENGKGALWGFENYNEPWEGGGISGYARDCLSYREWQKLMARAAYSVSKDIKICAASSIMNTEDKFYSTGPGPDGSYEFDKYIDVFTDHYVPPYMAYGPMVAKAHGKISVENETWLVISEYLLPQVVCQWLASGQHCISPWHPQVLFDSVAGAPQKYFCPTTVPVATAAFNHFMTGLRFEKLVFKDHLPWLFQFGKDDDPSGVCIMFGQLLTRGGPTPQDAPKGRLWAQVDQVDGGTITIDNADGALSFFDVAGNEVHKGERQVKLDLSFLPVYITSQQGPKLVGERVRQGRIDGKYPAEILPHDFTQRITDKDLTLNVEVANRINRTIKGTLKVTPPDGFALADNNRRVTLKAGEKKNIAFKFRTVAKNENNRYPFAFTFDTDAGACGYEEILNCTIAVKGTKKIDGDLGDWKDVPGITLVGEQKGIDKDELCRMPWLRLIKELPEGGLAAEVKLAWDESFIYVAARVNDSTPQMDKPRMEGRDELAYFHSAESDMQEPWKSWLQKHAPGHSFAEVPYIYKKKPFDGAYSGDQLQLAFNVTEGFHDLAPVTDVPYGFHAVPDTDYEFCAYLCADGGSELWNYLAPGIPRIHDWPHQPKGRPTTNPTPGSRHVVKQEGNVRLYEIAIPRERIADLKLEAGTRFKFTFFVGNDKGAKIFHGDDKAVTKSNGLTLHPYWWYSPSCEVEWALVE